MKKNCFMPFPFAKKYKKALLVGLLAFPMGCPPLSLSAKELSIFEQSYSLNLKFRNESLGNAIEQISRQAHVRIIYSNDQVDTQKKVSADIRTSDIREALLTILGNGYTLKQENNYITILRAEAAVPTTTVATQQKKGTVTGLLTDGDGNPVIGATVGIKGTTHGVTTDIDGRYILNDVAVGDVIEFRYIGMVTEERTYKGEETINIRMMEASVSLDDVVVIGYGQQKKESVVSSLSTVSSEVLSMPTRSLSNNLAGQISGVLAVQRSGEPGNDDAEFWIRGVSSYAGGTSPLVLVDGVPRAMNDIDVDEIESFTVLKDASATAVYGSEGANGVVLITSKRGRAQKTAVTFNAQYSIMTPTRMPELMPSYDYLSMWNEATWNDANNPSLDAFDAPYSQEVLDLYRSGVDTDLYPNSIWTDLLASHTHSQRYTVNFRGGSEKTRFFASGAYYQESGIFKSNPLENYDANIGLKRYNLRSNIDMDITKTTELSIDLAGQYKTQNNPGNTSDQIFRHIVLFPTHLVPFIWSDGTAAVCETDADGRYNPYNLLNFSGYTKTWSASLQTKATLKQKLDFITKGLSIQGTLSFDADFSSQMKRTMSPDKYTVSGRDEDGNLIKALKSAGTPLGDVAYSSAFGEKKIYIEAQLNYARVFADKHDVTATIVYNQKENQYQGVANDYAGIVLLPYRKQNIVGRGTYGYDGRYMLEASFGATGSENFAPSHRWGIFPAVGVAWNMHAEKFMQKGRTQDFINKFRARFSYGLTGNDQSADTENDRFMYREMIVRSGTSYIGLSPGASGGATNGFTKTYEYTFAAPNLTWETEKKMNVGLDLGLFRGRVDITADYFSNRREDILIERVTIPTATGFRENPWQNFGITTNKGMDANVILKQSIGEWNLSARGNFTYAKNKYVEKDEIPQAFPWLAQTGTSIGVNKIYIAEGLFTPDDFDITQNADGSYNYSLKENIASYDQNVKPGDIKYKDLNEDGKIDESDMTYYSGIYPYDPQIVYGFGVNVEYKGFFVGVFFQGQAKASTNLKASTNYFIPFALGRDQSSARVEAADHWTASDPYNTDVLYPRLHTNKYDNNVLESTWWYRDASFLRLKNVEFGYEFDKRWVQKMKMQNLRIYLQGTNVAVWDHIKMWDPELGNSGAKYPICSTWTIGLDVTF